ncbi:hypothetical protein BR93DRAFT_26610 [Coniochaeta sp. PMI_546]|nr:hypothetical protein BR93DRAFT_26610 [Coniochaeta sp. PMI_546]
MPTWKGPWVKVSKSFVTAHKLGCPWYLTVKCCATSNSTVTVNLHPKSQFPLDAQYSRATQESNFKTLSTQTIHMHHFSVFARYLQGCHCSHLGFLRYRTLTRLRGCFCHTARRQLSPWERKHRTSGPGFLTQLLAKPTPQPDAILVHSHVFWCVTLLCDKVALVGTYFHHSSSSPTRFSETGGPSERI